MCEGEERAERKKRWGGGGGGSKQKWMSQPVQGNGIPNMLGEKRTFRHLTRLDAVEWFGEIHVEKNLLISPKHWFILFDSIETYNASL